MLTRKQYFPGQAPEEQVALFIRRHWMAFVPWLIFAPILYVAYFFISLFLWNAPQPVVFNDITVNQVRFLLVTLSTMFYLSVLFGFLRAWMCHYLSISIVTEQRLINIEQQGIFIRKISEQSLLRVQDVSARQRGVFQHFFNYGVLYIETAGEQPNFELYNIPRPNDVAKTILNIQDHLEKTNQIQSRAGFENDSSNQILLDGADISSQRKHRHPLEELRPYFPEPGQNTKNHDESHNKQLVTPNTLKSHEGELHEGETIRIASRS